MTIDDLKALQTALASAIQAIESSQLRSMSDQELIEHALLYGPHSAVIGDFIVARRKEPRPSNADHTQPPAKPTKPSRWGRSHW